MKVRNRRGMSKKDAVVLLGAILAAASLAATEKVRTAQDVLKEVNGRLEREFISAE